MPVLECNFVGCSHCQCRGRVRWAIDARQVASECTWWGPNIRALAPLRSRGTVARVSNRHRPQHLTHGPAPLCAFFTGARKIDNAHEYASSTQRRVAGRYPRTTRRRRGLACCRAPCGLSPFGICRHSPDRTVRNRGGARRAPAEKRTMLGRAQISEAVQMVIGAPCDGNVRSTGGLSIKPQRQRFRWGGAIGWKIV